jgi:hypothetical protein
MEIRAIAVADHPEQIVESRQQNWIVGRRYNLGPNRESVLVQFDQPLWEATVVELHHRPECILGSGALLLGAALDEVVAESGYQRCVLSSVASVDQCIKGTADVRESIPAGCCLFEAIDYAGCK